MTIATFQIKSPQIMRKLMLDFHLDKESAAAILGNLGHESGGLSSLQEINPTVAGSKGGYGWAQWTGPRRKSYEAYCARNKLNPASDQANYAYLFIELSGEYAGAIRAVKAPGTLRDKVENFEKVYEKAGVKAYASREKWAQRALEAYNKAPPLATPKDSKTTTAVKTTGWLGVLAGGIAAIVTWGQAHPWAVAFGVTGAIFLGLLIHTVHNMKEQINVSNIQDQA